MHISPSQPAFVVAIAIDLAFEIGPDREGDVELDREPGLAFETGVTLELDLGFRLYLGFGFDCDSAATRCWRGEWGGCFESWRRWVMRVGCVVVVVVVAVVFLELLSSARGVRVALRCPGIC